LWRGKTGNIRQRLVKQQYQQPNNKSMKMKMLMIAILSATLGSTGINHSAQAFAETVQTMDRADTATFKVYGKCGMCKKRIEGAAKKLEGVKSANWIVNSKILTVKYDGTKLKEMNIHESIAHVGHDTEKVKATDKAYDRLTGCCKYDRSQE
jgi:mercuric ion binding protein